MKKYKISFVVMFVILSLVISVQYLGLGPGIVLTFSLSLILAFFLYELDKWLTLRKYSNMFDNLYVLSTNPANGDELKLPEGVLRFVVHANYNKVIQEARNQELLLRKAQNPFFIRKITDAQRLQVVPIVFQSGVHVCEGWKQYKKRVIQTIKGDLSSKHEYLKKNKLEWYSTNADKQVTN